MECCEVPAPPTSFPPPRMWHVAVPAAFPHSTSSIESPTINRDPGGRSHPYAQSTRVQFHLAYQVSGSVWRCPQLHKQMTLSFRLRSVAMHAEARYQSTLSTGYRACGSVTLATSIRSRLSGFTNLYSLVIICNVDTVTANQLSCRRRRGRLQVLHYLPEVEQKEASV